jgi:hypothetical protein
VLKPEILGFRLSHNCKNIRISGIPACSVKKFYIIVVIVISTAVVVVIMIVFDLV